MTAESRRQLIDQNCKQLNKVAEMSVLGIQVVVIFLSYMVLISPLFAQKTLIQRKAIRNATKLPLRSSENNRLHFARAVMHA